MAGPFGYAAAGLSQGLAQGLQFGAQMADRQKSRDAEAAERADEKAHRLKMEQLAKAKERNEFVTGLLKNVTDGDPKDIIQMKLDVLGRGILGEEADGSPLFENLNTLLTSRDDVARQRGTQLLTALGLQDPDKVKQLNQMLVNDPIHAVNLLEKGVGELFKPPEKRRIGTSTRDTPGNRRVVTRYDQDTGEPLGEIDTGEVRPPQPQQSNTIAMTVDPRTGVVRLAQGNDPGAALAGLQDKDEAIKFLGRQGGVQNIVRIRNNLRKIASQSDNPNALLGFIGSASQFFDTVKSQATAAFRAGGMDVGNVEQLLDPKQYNLGWVDKIAANAEMSQRVKSNLIGLAYANLQANESGGRFTNQDMDRSLDELGARAGSIQQLMAGLDTVIANRHAALVDTAEANGYPKPNFLPDDLDTGVETQEAQGIDLPPQMKNVPDGSTVPDKTGKRWVKRNGKLYPVP